MKNRFLIFGLIIVLVIAFSVIAGFSHNDDEEGVFIKSSSKLNTISRRQEQEKKKEVYVYITKTGKKYHKGNCRYLKKSKTKIALKEACKRGYTSCKVCKPPKCPDK